METVLPKRNAITTRSQAREQGQYLLRRSIVEAADRLLTQEGPDALTVRRIAQELECSTKIIYTMFRGKNGLANALYVEGCGRLQQSVEGAQPSSDPALYLRQLARAYWGFGMDNPGFYRVMFCGAIPDFAPDISSLGMMQRAFEKVVSTAQEYQGQGLLPADNPVALTKALWAALHGVVTLDLMGHFPESQEAQDVFTRVTEAMVSTLVPGSSRET